MNNSKISVENVTLDQEPRYDISPMLRQRETELVAIIEAIENVSYSEYWKLLQQKVFNGVLASIHRRMKNEKDTTELFRLQGQLGWAEKYSDLSKLATAFRKELENVRNQLKQHG